MIPLKSDAGKPSRFQSARKIVSVPLLQAVNDYHFDMQVPDVILAAVWIEAIDKSSDN